MVANLKGVTKLKIEGRPNGESTHVEDFVQNLAQANATIVGFSREHRDRALVNGEAHYVEDIREGYDTLIHHHRCQ